MGPTSDRERQWELRIEKAEAEAELLRTQVNTLLEVLARFEKVYPAP